MTGPRFFDLDGVRLAVFERAGAEPPVFLAHATGFHARCWNQIVARVPHRRAIAFDMRGHGLSSKPEPPYRWRQFGEDTAMLVRELNLHGATGVGHSMGGHSMSLAAALVPDAFAELILVDPVIMPPALYTGRPREAHYARKRRNDWQSPDEILNASRIVRPSAIGTRLFCATIATMAWCRPSTALAIYWLVRLMLKPRSTKPVRSMTQTFMPSSEKSRRPSP